MTDIICGSCKFWNPDKICTENSASHNWKPHTMDENDSCANFEERKVDEFIFEDLIKVLKKYLDLKEEYYTLVATWIIGTYLHKNFYTYPYLFFNAMKGSGKSRALKLIAHLSYKGEVVSSLNEAVLFRSEPNATFCIDEFESIANKEKQALRELLNASYKKGTIIKRMKESRQLNPETGKPEKTFVVESFEPFRPIAMANIWGMEEVLNDRCITLILEKSNNDLITNLLEIFDIDKEILDLKTRLVEFGAVISSLGSRKEHIQMLQDWNSYLSSNITTHNYTHTHTTHNYTQLLFNKIRESGISARALELSFPLIITSEYFGKSEEMIKILKEIMDEKREDELFESKDVQLFDFISQKNECAGEFKPVSELTSEFKIFLAQDNDDEIRWLNCKWMGKALKRLVLISKKRKVRHGIEVILNLNKAKDRIKTFGIIETSPQPISKGETGHLAGDVT